MKPWPYPRWIGHRGAGPLAPENTLAAFELGARFGYRMFECDARLSADEQVFLLHDATLERTTNGSGAAGELDWPALSQLDAGSWHSPAHAGEPLPSLALLARWCMERGCLLNIEIKPDAGTERRTGEVVAREAAQLWHGQTTPPLLTSFSVQSLTGASKAAPELPRGLLLKTLHEGWLQQARTLACVAVVCHHPLWNAATVAQVHDAGMRCLSYTVNDEAVARHLIELGTDGIITDWVDRFRPD
ncbi:MAG: glycerophosphodiester phosphodiesterase [Limnohabitans sp.]